MDSRGPPPPLPHNQLHHHLHHHQPPQGMMIHHQHHHHADSGYPVTMAANTIANRQMITPNSSSSPSSMLQAQHHYHSANNRFPFNSPVMNTTPVSSKVDLETLNSPYSGDDSSGMRPSPSGFGIDSQNKKKRGRPRKYSPDGGGSNIALGLAPTPISSPVGASGAAGAGDSSGVAASSSDKRHRGRPASSSKLQLDALGNCGVGFTPHVILVNSGEDIAAKIISFSKDGPRTVCVLSANGSICNVNLRQPVSGGVVSYEGRFEIISLTGSFLFSENGGGQVRSGGLSISLAGSDGCVLGGGVTGMLMAASPVQIIVGSFIADGKKPKYMPSVPHSHMLNFSAPPLQAPGTPPSEEESSEGSEENGSNHIDRTMGPYSNSNHPAIHNMQMYNPNPNTNPNPMGWPNPGSKMLQN